MRMATTHGTTPFTWLGMRSPAIVSASLTGSPVTCFVVATTRNSWTAWRRRHERAFLLSKFIYSGRNDDDRSRAPDSARLCLLRRHRRAFRRGESCAPDSRRRHGANLRVRRHRHSPQGIAVVDRRWRVGRDRDRRSTLTRNFFLLAAGWPLAVADRMDVVAAPTAGELRVLRDLHKRTEIAHASNTRRSKKTPRPAPASHVNP